VDDHLSRIEQEGDEKPMEILIDDTFLDEFLYAIEIATILWYADIVNYLVYGIIPFDFSYQKKKNSSPIPSTTNGKILFLQALC